MTLEVDRRGFLLQQTLGSMRAIRCRGASSGWLRRWVDADRNNSARLWWETPRQLASAPGSRRTAATASADKKSSSPMADNIVIRHRMLELPDALCSCKRQRVASAKSFLGR